MESDLMYAEGEIAALDRQLAAANATLDRLTAFLAAWREIESAWNDFVDGRSPPGTMTALGIAHQMTNAAAARFGIEASDVRSAGRVIQKLLGGN